MTAMTPLNVIQPGRSDQEYVRLFGRASLHWLKHLGDEADVEVGVALACPSLPHIPDANTLLDFALPRGISVETAITQFEAYYQRAGAACARVRVSPDLPPPVLAEAAEAFARRGYRPQKLTVMVLQQAAGPAALEMEDFTIVPARASYRHAVALEQASCLPAQAREAEEAAWLHLDDPRYDALVAIDAEGNAVAGVGVLAIGDVGLLRSPVVMGDAGQAEHKQLAEVMLARAIEIAARSLFRHLLAGVEEQDVQTSSLLQRHGFRAVGELMQFVRAV